MERKQVWLGLIVTSLAVASAPHPVRAAQDDADSLIKQGVELRKQGKDREALAALQKALALKETPRALAQVGLAEYALGIWLSSEEHLAGALRHEDDAWVKRNKEALTEALNGVGEHLGTVEIWGEPAGAEVIVNGKPAGNLPSPPPVRVVAGACSIVVRAEGYEEVSRTLRVSAKDLMRENVQLAPVPSPRAVAAVTAPVPPPAANEPGASIASGSSGEGAQAEERPGLMRKWWFWTAIGAAVVGGAVGVFLLTRPNDALTCPAGVECP